ncbi:putative translation initiation factor IF-2 [uncultured archaeon]|nr:putative translation initiation factor IF-2 [uncultured archaeon]
MVFSMLRSPIVCILAHVDHGKTSILDRIRGTAIAAREAGGITQMIGASYLSRDSILASCGPLRASADKMLKVPGLLFIDTPGHEAFTSMRERGGSIADIAILVIDIMQGIQPQTIESIKILRSQKTPFVIALNKVDLIQGWKAQPTASFAQSVDTQSPQVQQLLEEKLYAVVGRLSELGMESERFDRVSDFTKQLVMVPTSAKTGEGMAELLLSLAGLSQKYLAGALESEVSGPGRGSILEVKEEKGLGVTIDVIVYDGTLHRNDLVVFGTPQGARVVKIRGLLRPPMPGEVPPAGSRYMYIDEVHAAAGVKIYAPGLEGVLAGSPIEVVGAPELTPGLEESITSQIKQILVSSETLAGVVVKADTLGSAEAFMRLLAGAQIPVRSVDVGPVGKKDVISARAAAMQNKYLGVVLAFNVPLMPEALEEAQRGSVKIFQSEIIYRVLEDYLAWLKEEKERDQRAVLSELALPAKIVALPNCFFRLCKPAIFGVEVVAGRLRPGARLMNARGEMIGEVKAIQDKKESLDLLTEKQQAAISMDEPYCGKTFKAGEQLYVYISKQQAERLRGSPGLLTPKELELLEEIQRALGASVI